MHTDARVLLNSVNCIVSVECHTTVINYAAGCDVQRPDQLLGESHHRRGDGKAEDDDSKERVDRQNERSHRLTTERQQETDEPEQPLKPHQLSTVSESFYGERNIPGHLYFRINETKPNPKAPFTRYNLL